MVGLRPLNDAHPRRCGAEAEAMIEAIRTGEYHPFTGPINRQDGTPWLAEGETAPDGDLLGMGFYVEGMTGDVPPELRA
jgi:basic membrane protein A and related proteins